MFVVVGNEELIGAPRLKESITCDLCGQKHEVEYANKVLKDGTKVPSKLLAFYT
jgi:hypothetical protein